MTAEDWPIRGATPPNRAAQDPLAAEPHGGFGLSVAALLVGAAFWSQGAWAQWLAVAGAILVLVGVADLSQTRHSLKRKLPGAGQLPLARRADPPRLRQYLFEADEEAVPFSRNQRSLVYRRSKGEVGERAFGTLLDVYRDDYEFIAHSIRPVPVADPKSFRITIGGPLCARPYSASVLNISAMSFGSLSANAIPRAEPRRGQGRFYHDTGEGSISPYHREGGGDIVWESAAATSAAATTRAASRPSGSPPRPGDAGQDDRDQAEPGRQARPRRVLPAPEGHAGDSATRGVPMGRDCILAARHSAFSTPREMMAFIAQLRELSGGKPVGFKLCIGLPWEFMGIVKAMLETGVPRLHRRRRRRGRHRCRADRIQRPHRRADARRAAVRAQHARRGGLRGTSRSARPAA
jgi:hypothetical protein